MLKIVSAFLVALLGLAAFDFAMRMRPSGGENLPGNGVVFTGQFDRVRAGLQLLEKGRFDRLFISGVNAGAGINPEHFADQFDLSPQLREALASGTLMLGTQANSTVENGLETACWYRQEKLNGPLLVITGRDHMPRASIALEGSLPEVIIERLPIDDGEPSLTKLVGEFGGYVATVAFRTIKSLADTVGLRRLRGEFDCLLENQVSPAP
jgi:hypothetical protein